MTTISAKLTGNANDLQMVLACAIRFNSTKLLSQNSLIVTWDCETPDYNKAINECISFVSLEEVEKWGCKLETIA